MTFLSLYFTSSWFVLLSTGDVTGRTFSTTKNTCNDEVHGSPIPCAPQLHNVAFGKTAEVENTCGDVAVQRMCSQGKCDICDRNIRSMRYSVEFLTDLDLALSPTCWRSSNNVTEDYTIRMSFGKQHEITYINVKFCKPTPSILAFYKSSDNGSSWDLLNRYVTERDYPEGRFRGSAGPRRQSIVSVIDRKLTGRVGFSMYEVWHKSMDLKWRSSYHNWISATDVKLVMSPPSIAIASGVEDTAYHSLADFVIGGRCMCNGHGRLCEKNSEGQLACVCEHNTDGIDCERCKDFYQDVPWARAATFRKHQCIACMCHNHTDRCRFDRDLYKQSGRRSGGVCSDCQHNTKGAHCELCTSGYRRNLLFSMDHAQACTECSCHTIGSTSAICNQTSGQCPCKEGVTGQLCDRCQMGYHQTKNAARPCIRLPNTVNIRLGSYKMRKNKVCSTCQVVASTLSLQDFCVSKYMLLVRVRQRKLKPLITYYELSVVNVIERGQFSMPINERGAFIGRHIRYDCPSCTELQLDALYLLTSSLVPLGNASSSRLRLSKPLVAVEWSPKIVHRLRRFGLMKDFGFCHRFEQ